MDDDAKKNAIMFAIIGFCLPFSIFKLVIGMGYLTSLLIAAVLAVVGFFAGKAMGG